MLGRNTFDIRDKSANAQIGKTQIFLRHPVLFRHNIEITMHEHHHEYQYYLQYSYHQCRHDNLVITLAIAEG